MTTKTAVTTTQTASIQAVLNNNNLWTYGSLIVINLNGVVSDRLNNTQTGDIE